MSSNIDLTLRVLKDARKLIETPDRWIKGAYCLPRLDGVECFCLEGAIDRATTPIGVGATPANAQTPRTHAHAYRLVKKAIKKRKGRIMAACTYNDSPTTTHKDVLAVLDGAIEIAQNQWDSVEP